MRKIFENDQKIFINGREFIYLNSYKDCPNKFRFKDVETNLRMDIWMDNSGYWVTDPQSWLKLMGIEPGAKLFSTVFGEVEFVKCSHNFIFCKVDEDIDIVFSMHGRACWYNEKYKCYRFDDEADIVLFPCKEIKNWVLNVNV